VKPTGLAASAFGPSSEKSEDAAPSMGDDEGAEGLTIAADEVWTAIKSDDRAGFGEALHAYVELCRR